MARRIFPLFSCCQPGYQRLLETTIPPTINKNASA